MLIGRRRWIGICFCFSACDTAAEDLVSAQTRRAAPGGKRRCCDWALPVTRRLFNVDSNTCELTTHGFHFLSPICLVRKGLLLQLSVTLHSVSGDGKTAAQSRVTSGFGNSKRVLNADRAWISFYQLALKLYATVSWGAAQVLKSQPPDAAFSCVKMLKQHAVAWVLFSVKGKGTRPRPLVYSSADTRSSTKPNEHPTGTEVALKCPLYPLYLHF